MGKKRKKKMKPKQAYRKGLKLEETKQKILDALEDKKEFEVSYAERVIYSKTFKAKNKEELEDKFMDGELEFKEKDIYEGEFVEDSLEIEEVED